MVFVINSVKLYGYNGETSVRRLAHIKQELRTVDFCPNGGTKNAVELQDEWLRRFNDMEERLHQGSSKLERLLGLIHNIHWTHIRFNYTEYGQN